MAPSRTVCVVFPRLGRADPCGSVVAGSSAREMDGPRGSV